MTLNMCDTKARAQAIDITASWIIQAPAGSGKTELLVQRILAALATCEHAPEEILAITFTKKAAAEMRARVFKALNLSHQKDQSLAPHQRKTKQLAQLACQQNERKQWRLFENPNRLQIKTIDALCHQICKQSGLQPAMPHLSPMALYRRVARNFLQEAVVRQDVHTKTLLKHFHHHTQYVEQLCALALAERDQWLPYLHIGDADSLFAANQKYLRMLCLENCQQLTDVLRAWMTPAWLDAIVFSFDQQGIAWTGLATTVTEKNLMDAYRTLKTLTTICLKQDATPRKTVTKRQGFPAVSNARCQTDKAAYTLHKANMMACLEALSNATQPLQCLQNMQGLPEPNYPRHYQGILTCMTSLLPQLVAYLNWVCLSEHTSDFTHTALNAIGILKHTQYCPSDIWLDQNVAIRHVLVDEFQDTSVTQLTLLEALVESWNPCEDGSTLCIVGDPMQSIYRFRQADASLFEQVVREGLGPIQPQSIQLTSNFRSQSGLVDWFNVFFKSLFPKTHDADVGAFPYHACVAMQQGPGRVQTNWWHAEDMTAEAQDIAQACQKLCQQGETSIAILVRSRRIAQPIVQALKDHGMTFKRDGLDALSDTAIVKDLMLMLDFLWHPYDDLTLANLLCSARIAIPHQKLYDLRRIAPQKPLWQTLSFQSNHPIIQTIQHDHRHAIELLQGCLNRSTVESLHDVMFHYWQCIVPDAGCPDDTDALMFFQCLNRCEQTMTNDFYPTLLDMLDKTTSSTMHADAACITVMTIHQAKGLEFDHVFVPGMGTITPPRQQKILMLDQNKQNDALLMLPSKSTYGDHSAAHLYLYEKAHKQDIQECIRLLYVAATRARIGLYWSGTVKEPERVPSRAPMAWMWPHLKPHECKVQTPFHVRPEISQEIYKNWPLTNNCSNQKISLGQASMSASMPALETFEIRWGKVVHALMACLMQSRSLDTDFLLQQTIAHCSDLRMPHDEKHRIETNLRHIIPKVLVQPKVKWLLAQKVHLHCEQPIYTANGKHFVLDLCFKTGDFFWIVDYKIFKKDNRSLAEIFQPYYDKMYHYRDACAHHSQTIQMVLFNPITGDWHEVPGKRMH